ncbi:endonuclease/exonuclease/phosphatase family protein [bacterium]|nr:endonuclease/exonuclease/phosphatase family protein [bacterium]
MMKNKRMIWLITLIMSMVFSVSISLYAEIEATIEVMPRSAAAKCEERSPFAVFLKVTGLEADATDYTFTLRIINVTGSDCGFFARNDCCCFSEKDYIELGIPDAGGTVRLWVYLRSSKGNPEPGEYHLRLRVKKDGSDVNGGSWDLPELIRFLDMSDTGDGAWVYAEKIFTKPGKVVLAFGCDEDPIGTYVTEDNGLSEGYPPKPGYFMMAVKANTPILRLELRDADNTVIDTKTSDSWWSGDPGSVTNLDDQQPPDEPIKTTIPEVQGEWMCSPMVGLFVQVVGVVIGDLQETYRDGFFIQDVTGDGNPETSDGIWIYQNDNPNIPDVNRRDEVTVTGYVIEYNELTEIDVSGAQGEVIINSSGHELPDPFELEPQAVLADALMYFESLEGMYVATPDGVVVGPTDDNGIFIIVRQSVFTGRYFFNPVTENGDRIMVDNDIGFPINDVKLDYSISNVLGVMDYGYVGYDELYYKIQLTETCNIETSPDPEPIPPANREVEFSVATFNLETFESTGLFDTVDNPYTDDIVLSPENYQCKLDKLAYAIRDDDGLFAPDVIAVQEAENINVLNDLADQPELSEFSYIAELIEGPPGNHGLNVGVLVRGDRVNVIDVHQAEPLPPDPGGCGSDGLLFSRPPLIITLDIYPMQIDVGTPRRITLIVNHFKSMIGGTAETEPCRIEQARFVVKLVDEILADAPDADVLVIGDINATRDTPPVTIFTNGTTPGSQLQILNFHSSIPDQYTYVYYGNAQYLDYIFATPHFTRTFRSTHIAHINAGYPDTLSKDCETMNQSSDHDPLVARFAFVEPVDGDLSGDGTISAYDAALILQYVVGLRDSFPVRMLNSPGGIAPRDYIFSIPEQSAKVGEIIRVPIVIDDATGLTAGGISLKYDSTILKAVDVATQILPNQSYWEANTDLKGEVRFAFASHNEATKGEGNLLTVGFEVLHQTEGKVSPLILSDVQLANSSNITKVDGSVKILTPKFALLQNFPNPFNPETWIPYQLERAADVTIRIYNQHGQLVRILNPGVQQAGSYLTKDRAAYWNGRNDTEEAVASGVYFYTLDLRGGNKYFRATKKMVIMK